MNYKVLKVILNDFSTEGLFDTMKKCNEFKKLYCSEIKPILFKKYKKEHREIKIGLEYNFNHFFWTYLYPDAEKKFKKELNNDPNLNIKEYVDNLKKDEKEKDKKERNIIENDFYNKNKQLFTKLSQKLMQANEEAITKCKQDFDNLLNKYRNEKNSCINPKKSNKEIMNCLITCKSASNYLLNIMNVSNKYKNSETDHYFAVSISDWQDLSDTFENYTSSDLKNCIDDWDHIYPLSNIIFNAWVDLAIKCIKEILGNHIVNIGEADRRYVEVIVR